MANIEIDDLSPRIAYTATAGQTVFPIPFAFFSDSDIVVYVNDYLVSDDDYAVSGEGDSDAGSRLVTFDTGLTLDDAVVIVRDIAIERTTFFPTSGPLQIASLNTLLSRMFAILQQLEDGIVRTLRLAASDPTDNLDIPSASERATKFLAFDAEGAPMVAATVTDVPVSAFMQTVLDDSSAGAARATLGITDTTAYVGTFNRLHFR